MRHTLLSSALQQKQQQQQQLYEWFGRSEQFGLCRRVRVIYGLPVTRFSRPIGLVCDPV